MQYADADLLHIQIIFCTSDDLNGFLATYLLPLFQSIIEVLVKITLIYLEWIVVSGYLRAPNLSCSSPEWI